METKIIETKKQIVGANGIPLASSLKKQQSSMQQKKQAASIMGFGLNCINAVNKMKLNENPAASGIRVGEIDIKGKKYDIVIGLILKEEISNERKEILRPV